MNNSMKEVIIREFMVKYDFTNENWSIKEIKYILQNKLGEVPAIKVNYEKDIMVNEINGKVKEISKMKSIEVIFTDLDDSMKKVEFEIEL